MSGSDSAKYIAMMVIFLGIVYASEKTENIQIVSAKPLDDMMMILTFSMDYF